MRLYNYTVLKTREKKLYNIGGHSIDGGFSVNFLKIVAPVTIAFIILGCIISIPFGIRFFNFLEPGFNWKYTLFWIAAGIGVGCGLWYIEFSGYKLYQYLLAYLKPKKVYMNDKKHTVYNLTNVEINTFVKSIL